MSWQMNMELAILTLWWCMSAVTKQHWYISVHFNDWSQARHSLSVHTTLFDNKGVFATRFGIFRKDNVKKESRLREKHITNRYYSIGLWTLAKILKWRRKKRSLSRPISGSADMKCKKLGFRKSSFTILAFPHACSVKIFSNKWVRRFLQFVRFLKRRKMVVSTKSCIFCVQWCYKTRLKHHPFSKKKTEKLVLVFFCKSEWDFLTEN